MPYPGKALYTNEVWLRRKYLRERKTAKEIAAMANTTEMTVTRYLTKYGIIKNPRTWRRK